MPDNPNDPNKEEGFVSRWSRRKQQVAAEASSEQVMAKTISKEAATESLKNSSDVKVIQEELIDPEVIKAQRLEALNKLTDEDMPDIETLDENSDFSGFMSTSVSEGLRNMALKKLFMGKSYNIRDGLD